MAKQTNKAGHKYFNGIPLSDIKHKSEEKWFSFIKHKAEELGYGNLQVNLTVKNGKIVAIKNIREEENFNISG